MISLTLVIAASFLAGVLVGGIGMILFVWALMEAVDATRG